MKSDVQKRKINKKSFQLSDDQEIALDQLITFCQTKGAEVISLAGPAGSGKSTLVREFLEKIRHHKRDRDIYLCATTHKACKVLKQQTSKKTQTIHSLLNLRPKLSTHDGQIHLIQKGFPNDIEDKALLIIDEASMIGQDLLQFISKVVDRFNLKVIFIGDQFQLPPVENNTERPLVFGGIIPTVELTEIHRQAQNNPIIQYASEWRRCLENKQFDHLPKIEHHTDELFTCPKLNFRDHAVDLIRSDEYKKSSDFCRVLAWQNKVVNIWNQHLRKKLLGSIADRFRYVEGEKLVVNQPIINQSEVIVVPSDVTVKIVRIKNGEVEGVDGFFLDVEDEDSEFWEDDIFVPNNLEDAEKRKQELIQDAFNAKKTYGKGHLTTNTAWKRFFDFQRTICDLRLPYAQTVHKSQGSTYQHSLLVGDDIIGAKRFSTEMYCRLMYVGITRAAQSVAIQE